jgi:hypothetical protein
MPQGTCVGAVGAMNPTRSFPTRPDQTACLVVAENASEEPDRSEPMLDRLPFIVAGPEQTASGGKQKR